MEASNQRREGEIIGDFPNNVDDHAPSLYTDIQYAMEDVGHPG
jgi:hypothetical protein